MKQIRPGLGGVILLYLQFESRLLGSFVKLSCQTFDSFISVIPAFAGIQNGSMPQSDLHTEALWIPAFAGMTGQFDETP